MPFGSEVKAGPKPAVFGTLKLGRLFWDTFLGQKTQQLAVLFYYLNANGFSDYYDIS